MGSSRRKGRDYAVSYSVLPVIGWGLFYGFYSTDLFVPDARFTVSAVPENDKNQISCITKSSLAGLCIAVISCNRSDYLRVALAHLFQFIAKSEPALSYELIWIDQATTNRASLSKLYRFGKRFLFSRPVGYSVSFRLAFSQCTCEYIFLLEDDWLAVNSSLPWFSFSIDLLAHAPEAMYAILLRMVAMNGPIYRTTVQSCLVPSGTVWRFGQRTFHFTNGPAVYRMSSIRHILAKYDYTNEGGVSEVAKELGYTLSFWADGIASPSQVPIRFRHIGLRSTKYKTISTCKGEVYD
jgi:hypothetical protein